MKITIAMPAYNEQDNLPVVVKDAFEVLEKLTSEYEVLVVNDGSTDDTKEVLEGLKKKYAKLRVINFETNKGVGIANYTIYSSVKEGVLFWNASDNQIRMNELLKLIPYIEDYDIVVGNRYKRQDNFTRRLLSGLFNLGIVLRFGVPIKDIDSVKVYRTSVFEKVNPKLRTAFIETEILIKALRSGLKVKEVNIEHHPRVKGKPKGVSLRVVIPQLRDYLKAFFGMV